MTDKKLKQFDLYQDRNEGAIVAYVLLCAGLTCLLGAAVVVLWFI